MNGEEIAETIGHQLGGFNRLKVMIGAKDFSYTHIDSYLAFKFMTGDQGINYLKITLNVMDLYDLEFGKIRGHKYTIIKRYDDIYFDQLRSLFEQTTKLYLTF